MVECNSNSKTLLKLEDSTTTSTSTSTSTSYLESKLVVCKKENPFSLSETSVKKPTMFPIPKSQVFGKVKDFLGVISESNKKLLHDAKENPDNYDIEVLSGKESEYIEMDLMLGITDLQTPEAVAAAESAIAGYKPVIPLAESSSGSESENFNDDDDNNNQENKKDEHDDEAGSQSLKFRSKDAERNFSCRKSRKRKSIKRPKIVELSSSEDFKDIDIVK